jgi:hypothetical protein
MEETSYKTQDFGFAGQIKSFRRPHLTRELYVVHAWVRLYFHTKVRKCTFWWLIYSSKLRAINNVKKVSHMLFQKPQF